MPERRPRVGVGLRLAVVGLGADVPQPVLGVEADRSELRPSVQHADADLVDEVLDRQRHELVEDGVREVGDLLGGDVLRCVPENGVGRIGVGPADVGPDVQRPVAALGKGRVLVAGEVREGGAGDLDQLELATAGLVVGDLDAAGGVAGQLQACGAVVAIGRG